MGEAFDITQHLSTDGEDQDSSTVIVGYCPEQKRSEGERKGDLDQYERLDGNRNQTTESLAIKKLGMLLYKEEDSWRFLWRKKDEKQRLEQNNCVEREGEDTVQKKVNALRELRRLLSRSDFPFVEVAIKCGAIPLLAQCLSFGSEDEQLLEAAWCLTNIVAGKPEETKALLPTLPLLIYHFGGHGSISVLLEERAEIVDWIHEGGGEVVDTLTEKNINYTVESRGALCSPTQYSGTTNVSSHWIRSCLQVAWVARQDAYINFSDPNNFRKALQSVIGGLPFW